MKIGNRLVFSKRHNMVRKGMLGLFANLLLISGIVFGFEIILIFLGIGDIFLPLTSSACALLTKVFF
jgi:hypothetical protein